MPVVMIVVRVAVPVIIVRIFMAMIVMGIAVLLVLAVMVPVVVPHFHAAIVAVPVLFPTGMPSPVCAFSAPRKRTMVSKTWIIGAIDISVKAYRPMKPRPGAEEHASREPLRPVIAKRGARIRCIVEVAIGTHWRHANADADLR